MEMHDRFDDCDRFDAGLPALLAGDLGAAERSALAAHSHACRRCAEAWRLARSVDRMVGAWSAPDLPDQLAAQVLAALSAPATCDEVAADLFAHLSEQLEPSRSSAIEEHLARCAGCATDLRDAEALQQRLAAWQAPEPPHDLFDRTLVRCGLQRPTPRTAFRITGRVGWAVAAAVLLSALAWSLRGPAVATAPVDVAMRQLDATRELRLNLVSFERAPSSIGSFDRQPAIAGRALRPTGNGFHMALRRVKTESRDEESTRSR